MRIEQGRLEDFIGKAVVCITTNGTVLKNGKANMGGGNAKTIAQLLPWIPQKLGEKIAQAGNRVHLLGEGIVSFPVEHSFDSWADLPLVQQSAQQLRALADQNNWQQIVLPLPGCGGGGLDRKVVEKLLAEYLDERFLILTQ